MDPLERADRLRREADEVLALVRLREIVEPYGKVVPTGSYFLDAMVYPDIDVYVPAMPVAELFHVGALLAECPKVVQVVFERSNEPDLPDGLYLKPRIAHGDWGRPWKIDIWSVGADVADRRMAELRRFRSLLTPDLRERVVRYKASVLSAQGRTPMHSGYYVYKAILDEGLDDHAEITNYLARHGIDVGVSAV